MTETVLQAALRATTPERFRAAGAYDAVVIGAGAAGGVAAYYLTAAGLRVLVLDAGPAQLPQRSLGKRLVRGAVSRVLGAGALTALDRRRQRVQSRCYAWPFAPEKFVDDLDCPYTTPLERPFEWIRSRQIGGRMFIPGHGLQYYRMGPHDLAPADGLSLAWPLRPGELDPWYTVVERQIGLAGARDGLPCVPDGALAQVLEPSPTEAMLQAAIAQRWQGGRAVLGRYGKPFDALQAAAETGRLLIRQGAIVREIEVEPSGRVSGAVWLDQQTGSDERAHAPLVFLCASALESTRLLLLSRSPRGGRGLGARSGALGHFLMDHMRIRAEGVGPELPPGPPAAQGRCLYLPRFDARNAGTLRPGRGFGVQLYQNPGEANGPSRFTMACFGEMLPRRDNQVILDPFRRDAWGIPVLRIDCTISDIERARARDQVTALRELAEVAGVTLTHIDEAPTAPGSAVHECGTARMGSDPSNSVLDPSNQCWEAKGLYVTDAACFPSQGSQNPTLTILALTARACDHAVQTMR